MLLCFQAFLTLLAVLTTVDGSILDLVAGCGNSLNITNLEAGSSALREGQAGWQALIRENSKFKCGGSLISQRWIITAASCVYGNLNPSRYLINLGLNDFNENWTIRAVSKIIIHPAFDQESLKFDIALIKMDQSVDFWLEKPKNFNIVPICVPDGSENYVNKNGIATGYASFSSGFIETEEIKSKKMISLDILEDSNCTAKHPMSGNTAVNTFIQVCATEIDPREDQCGLDRGGPLAVQGEDGRWHLIGITSWGYKPCQNGGVFTRISNFADYILNVIKTN